MKITVARGELAAALLFASTDENRFSLNGVCVECKTGKVPIVVATDGRRLVTIQTQADQSCDVTEDHSFILKPDWVKAIVALSKACGGTLHSWIKIEHAHGHRRLDFEFIGCEMTLNADTTATFIEADFPDWRKVVPPKTKTPQVIRNLGINAAMIGDFAKAAKLIGCESPIVQMYLAGKDNCVEIKLSGMSNFYGLVMPCAADEDLNCQPEFATIVEQFKEATVETVYDGSDPEEKPHVTTPTVGDKKRGVK